MNSPLQNNGNIGRGLSHIILAHHLPPPPTHTHKNILMLTHPSRLMAILAVACPISFLDLVTTLYCPPPLPSIQTLLTHPSRLMAILAVASPILFLAMTLYMLYSPPPPPPTPASYKHCQLTPPD